MKTYQKLARLIDQKNRAQHIEPGKFAWESVAEAGIRKIMDSAPSGSGFDCGTKLSDDSKADKIVFTTEFHHMDEMGGYDGWTQHKVTLRPSLAFGFKISVSGRDRNQIKDYIYDAFSSWLEEEVKEEIPA